MKEQVQKEQQKCDKEVEKSKKATEKMRTTKEALKLAKNEVSKLKADFRGFRHSNTNHPLTKSFKAISKMTNPLIKDKEMETLLMKFRGRISMSNGGGVFCDVLDLVVGTRCRVQSIVHSSTVNGARCRLLTAMWVKSPRRVGVDDARLLIILTQVRGDQEKRIPGFAAQ